MNIQVIGSGCPKCKKLYELTKMAVEQLGSEASVEYSTDVTKIIQMNVMASPVLAIDGKPVVVGYLPNVDTIKQHIQEAEAAA